jgi:hypothetical protein
VDNAADSDNLTNVIRLLVEEIDTALGQDGWTFLPGPSAFPQMYAGAALRHAALLLEEMDVARVGGQETTVRILMRTHVETWLIGMYIALGGHDALDTVAADYQDAMEKWDHQLTAYNEKTLRATEKAERSNEKIRAANEGKLRWNEEHPDSPPKAPEPEVPVPTRIPVEFDLKPALAGAQTDVPAKPLSLSTVACRVDKLLDKVGDNLTAEATYEVMYRSLSTFAGHITLSLLDRYFPRDAGHYVRIARQPSVPSTALSFTRNTLVLTAMLAKRTLAIADTPAPVATAIEMSATDEDSAVE